MRACERASWSWISLSSSPLSKLVMRWRSVLALFRKFSARLMSSSSMYKRQMVIQWRIFSLSLSLCAPEDDSTGMRSRVRAAAVNSLLAW